jgi:hypothetical protein
MMSGYLSTPNMNDEAVEILKRLHRAVGELGHSLNWFVDRYGRVRLLVTAVSEWGEIQYQAGEEVHTLREPLARRSVNLDLSPVDVRILRTDGLLCYIEQQLGIALHAESADSPSGSSAERRAA